MDRISESHEAAGNRAEIAIEASLNYLEPSSEKPVYYAYEPPAGTPRSTGKFVAPDGAESETRAKWSATCRSTSTVFS